MVLLVGFLTAAVLSACTPARTQTLVDLTYAFDEETIYWPTNKHFQWEKTDWGMTAAGYWYASANFSASEHGGTHIDAPIHFSEGRLAVDQIPVEQLIGPAVVIDVRAQCSRNPDYELMVEDLATWESRHGPIPENSLVLILSGWGQRWPDRRRYLGTDTPENPQTFNFPGISRQAAELMVSRSNERRVCLDTASRHPGRSRDVTARRVLNGADVYALENVAALDRLPSRGATVFALPIKIK
ncbi:MAG: cyclase family protein, partial [Nitrospiraceae bacterium]